MLIQANIDVPCVVLDFPTQDRFVEELKTKRYDVIGISSIIPNILKVKRMCELIRQYQPNAKIVIGGHIANVPDLNQQINADFIVPGDGVNWFRNFLGENPHRPIRHPEIISAFGARSAGISLGKDVAATIIPSVGCPLGCNFCSTSAMFGGKGHSVDFYKTGDELYSIMCQLADRLGVRSFFMMDENFLLDRKRALRLLELMEEGHKAWSLYVFSSANALRKYTMDELVRLGVSWVWMGIEGEDSQYAKLKGVNTSDLVRDLQSHGIKVLGSTIIGLEDHTLADMDRIIEFAVRHVTAFHQFMLYTPIPGTPLHAELEERGLMKNSGDFHPGDIHGQLILNYRHPRLSDEDTAECMRRAFKRDFEVNGPSIVRIVKHMLAGWLKLKNHPDPRVRDRIEWESRALSTRFSALVGASEHYFRSNEVLHDKISLLLDQLHDAFGLKSRIWSCLGGLWLLRKIHQEERRLAAGWTYEPQTFYERNSEEADCSIALRSSVAAM